MDSWKLPGAPSLRGTPMPKQGFPPDVTIDDNDDEIDEHSPLFPPNLTDPPLPTIGDPIVPMCLCGSIATF